MTPATKIFTGILSCGAAAVGGHEVYAFATGKPGLIVQGSKSPTNNTDLDSATRQSENSEEQTTKNQVTTLLEELKKGCEIKVNGDSEREINVNTEKGLSNLLGVLRTTENDCKTEKSTDKKKIILKNTNTSWEKVSEKEQVLKLTKDKASFKCEIKIKTSDNKLKTVEIAEDSEIKGLLEKLEELKTTGCQNSISNTIHKIFEKKESGWTDLEEKEKIDAWTSSKDKFSSSAGQCILKILKNHESKDIESSDTLTGLYNFLEDSTTGAQVESACTEGSTDNKQEVVVQNNSGTWKIMNERDQIVGFLKDTTNFKCTIKIKTSDDTEPTQIIVGTPETSITGLLKKLKEIKSTTDCSEQKNLVLKRGDNNVWFTYPTIEQVKTLKQTLVGKCTVQIQNKNGEPREIDSTLSNESLNNLYKKLQDAQKTDCTNSEGSPQKTVTIKENDKNWDKTVVNTVSNPGSGS